MKPTLFCLLVALILSSNIAHAQVNLGNIIEVKPETKTCPGTSSFEYKPKANQDPGITALPDKNTVYTMIIVDPCVLTGGKDAKIGIVTDKQLLKEKNDPLPFWYFTAPQPSTMYVKP